MKTTRISKTVSGPYAESNATGRLFVRLAVLGVIGAFTAYVAGVVTAPIW